MHCHLVLTLACRRWATYRKRVEELKKTYGDKKVIVGVDRLDYIKGIPQKLQGLEEFFERFPEWVGKVVLIQVAVPSREDVEEYRQLKSEVDELVGRINSKYGASPSGYSVPKGAQL